MTQYERVMNRLEGKPVDRVPNVNILMQFAAREIGVTYSQYVTDYRRLVEANVACCEKYGVDMVSTISDPFREAADRGAAVRILTDDVPACHEFLIQEPGDLKKLTLVDPTTAPRMGDRVKACALYKQTVGHQFPILGWVEGPLAEACDLRGINEIMMDFFDTPEFVEELMRNCNEQAMLFAKAQIEAGADIIGVGDAAASLIGPELYEQYVFPREQELIREIHRLGAKAKLHICGNITDLLPSLVRTGADMIDIDTMVSMTRVASVFGDQSAPAGNVDTVKVMQQGTPEQVHAAVKACLAAGGPKVFLAAGCEVPKFTPPENLMAFRDALRE